MQSLPREHVLTYTTCTTMSNSLHCSAAKLMLIITHVNVTSNTSRKKIAYLLAEEFRQNACSFKFDIFKLRDLLRYKPLRNKKRV